MKNKKVLDSPRLLEAKKKRQEKLKKHFLISFFLLIAVFAGFIFISRWQKINIAEVKVSGNKILKNTELEFFVQKEISGKYLWVFPKTNILFYPKNNIGKKLLENFKRVEHTLVYLDKDNVLNISITERTPAYTWCGKEPKEKETEEQCYFMDKNGYIFDSAPYFSEEVYLKFYGSLDTDTEPLGSYFLPLLFDKLIVFKENIYNKSIKPASFFIKNTENEGVMFLVSSGADERGPKILFDLVDLTGKTAENLETVISTEPLATDLVEKYSEIEYIDLRFGNKVYYKLKQSE